MTELTKGPPLPGYIGPLDVDLRSLEETSVDSALIRRFAEELMLAFRKVTIKEGVDTPDGRIWTIVSFLYATDNRYKILFLCDEDGKTAGVAFLYCQCDESPDAKEVEKVRQAIRIFFLDTLHPQG